MDDEAVVTKRTPKIRGSRVQGPKDRQAIRQYVAEAVRHLVVEGGIDNVTIRDIARHLGYSSAVVQHYFANKREMMLYVHKYCTDLAARRVEEAMEKHPNSLKHCVLAYLPIDEERRTNWLMWIVFWGLAVADPDFSEVQRQGVVQSRALLKNRLEDMQQSGHADKGLDSEEIARVLVIFIQGIALQASFDPADWPVERQRAVVDRECDRLMNAYSA